MGKGVMLGVMAGALVSVSGLMFYDMKNMDVENLILCSSNEGGKPIPAPLCKYYMLNYRINAADIKQLSQGAGLDYILNSERPEKYDLARVFIAKGLDINGVNHYSDKAFTPLHSAVLLNDLERVRFLISQGADTRLRTKGDNMTALELAQKLTQANGVVEDRGEIITTLSAPGL